MFAFLYLRQYLLSYYTMFAVLTAGTKISMYPRSSWEDASKALVDGVTYLIIAGVAFEALILLILSIKYCGPTAANVYKLENLRASRVVKVWSVLKALLLVGCVCAGIYMAFAFESSRDRASRPIFMWALIYATFIGSALVGIMMFIQFAMAKKLSVTFDPAGWEAFVANAKYAKTDKPIKIKWWWMPTDVYYKLLECTDPELKAYEKRYPMSPCQVDVPENMSFIPQPIFPSFNDLNSPLPRMP